MLYFKSKYNANTIQNLPSNITLLGNSLGLKPSVMLSLTMFIVKFLRYQILENEYMIETTTKKKSTAVMCQIRPNYEWCDARLTLGILFRGQNYLRATVYSNDCKPKSIVHYTILQYCSLNILIRVISKPVIALNSF